MADETRTPQTEPAEGSREVIDHELARQNPKPTGETLRPDQAAEGGAGQNSARTEGTESRH